MKKQIFVASIVYTFLSVLQPLSNFVLLPVYTTYFSESQYGTFSILNNLNIFFSIIGGLAILQAIIAFYNSYNKDELNHYIGNILSFTMYFNLGLLLLTCLTGNIIFKIIFREHIDFFPNGILIVSYGLLTNITTGYFYFLKYERNVRRFALLSLSQFILSTLLQYFFIVYLKMSITGALTARVIVALIIFLLVVLYHYKYIFLRIDFTRFIKPSLKYSLYTIPSSVITWLSSYVDRFFIERFIDLRSLGIYSFLSTISSISEMGFLALGAAFQPFIFDFFKASDKKNANRMYKLFFLVTTCIISFIIFFGSNLDLFIHNKGYLEIVKYLTIMTIGYIFSAMAYLFSLQIIYAKKSHYFIYLGIIILISNLSLNAILIPVYGIWGAVVSSTLTKLISAILCFYFANRSYSISFEKNSYTLLFVLFLLMLFFGWLADKNYIPYNITGLLQFVTTLILIGIMYSKSILQSYQDITASLNKK